MPPLLTAALCCVLDAGRLMQMTLGMAQRLAAPGIMMKQATLTRSSCVRGEGVITRHCTHDALIVIMPDTQVSVQHRQQGWSVPCACYGA